MIKKYNVNRKSLQRGAALLTFLLLFVAVRQIVSWRPHLIGLQSENPPPFSTGFSTAKISPDGRLLFLDDGKAMHSRIWDLGHETVKIELPFTTRYTAFAPDSQSAIFWDAFDARHRCGIFSMNGGSQDRTFRLMREDASAFRYPRQGDEILFVSDGNLWRANIKNGNITPYIPALKLHPWSAFSDLSGGGTQLITSFNGGVRIFDTATGTEQHFFPNLRGVVGFSPDAATFWHSEARNHSYEFRRSRDCAFLWELEAPEIHIQYTADSKFVAVVTPQGMTYRDALTGKIVRTFLGPREAPFDIAADGSFAISCDSKGQIWRWRLF